MGWGTPDLHVAVTLGLERVGTRDVSFSGDENVCVASASWRGARLLVHGRRLVRPPGDGAVLPPPWFLRLQAGEASGPAERWGVVSEAGLTVQAASAPGWCSVAGPVAPVGSYSTLVGPLFDVLAKIHPFGSGAPTREWAFDSLRSHETPSSGQLSAVSGAALLTLSAAGVGLAVAFPPLAGLALNLVPPAAATGLALLGSGWARRQLLLRAHEQGRAVARAIRGTGLFEEVDAPSPGEPVWPPLVAPAGPEPGMLVQAGMRSLRLGARSDRLGLSLVVSLSAVAWPKGTPAAARLVPDSWAAAELRGPIELLVDLPSWSREVRGRERLRWLFDAADLAREALPDHLMRVSEAAGAARRGPYR